jgi:hypothetical protein
MKNEDLLKVFDYMSDIDDPQRDQDLREAVQNAGEVGVTLLLENLASGRYIKDTIWLCQCLKLQESIPSITKYLDSDEKTIRIAAAIALTKLGSPNGFNKLKQMFELGEIPEHWLSAYGISLDFSSENEASA